MLPHICSGSVGVKCDGEELQRDCVLMCDSNISFNRGRLTDETLMSNGKKNRAQVEKWWRL